jgi:hypothetical protein
MSSLSISIQQSSATATTKPSSLTKNTRLHTKTQNSTYNHLLIMPSTSAKAMISALAALSSVASLIMGSPIAGNTKRNDGSKLPEGEYTSGHDIVPYLLFRDDISAF